MCDGDHRYKYQNKDNIMNKIKPSEYYNAINVGKRAIGNNSVEINNEIYTPVSLDNDNNNIKANILSSSFSKRKLENRLISIDSAFNRISNDLKSVFNELKNN